MKTGNAKLKRRDLVSSELKHLKEENSELIYIQRIVSFDLVFEPVFFKRFKSQENRYPHSVGK